MWGKLIIYSIYLFLGIFLYCYLFFKPVGSVYPPGTPELFKQPPQPITLVKGTKIFNPEIPIEEIVIMRIETMAAIYNVDYDKAYKIAKCESRFNPKAKNPHSTAKGVYQFINSTWAENCQGDVYDYKDNIQCFMENFNKHNSWWAECLKQI